MRTHGTFMYWHMGAMARRLRRVTDFNLKGVNRAVTGLSGN
jgi:hypothetical protein